MFVKCFCGEYALDFGGKLDEHRIARNCAGERMTGYCASPSEGTVRCHYCSSLAELGAEGKPMPHKTYQKCAN